MPLKHTQVLESAGLSFHWGSTSEVRMYNRAFEILKQREILLLLLQLSCHLVAVVITQVQTKQIRINIHYTNETIQKHSTNNTKHSQYKYTYKVVQI